MTEIAVEAAMPASGGTSNETLASVPMADADAAIKGLAKALARDTAAPIADRHLRAEVRTTCYNQAVVLLRRFEAQQAVQRVRYRQLVNLLGGTAAVLAAALAVSLLV